MIKVDGNAFIFFSEPGNYVDMFKCGDVDPLTHVPSEFAKATR